MNHDSYPEIGERRHGLILVCHGDDKPTEFVDWLGQLVSSFEALSSICLNAGVEMDPLDGSSPIEGVIDFCQRLGIQFSSTMWEGSIVSGIYQTGWIKPGTARSTAANGKRLIHKLEEKINSSIRSSVINELAGIHDLEDFIERTTDDRRVLRGTIASLSAELSVTKSDLGKTREIVKALNEHSTEKIDLACIQLASALLSNEKTRLVAGPLVLWDDGIIYAIHSWGGVPMPEGSSPALLLDGIKRSGRTVVLIAEVTMIGAWISGPIYRKGPNHIAGWSNVWTIQENRKRSFVADPPMFAEQVKLIHETLLADNESWRIS